MKSTNGMCDMDYKKKEFGIKNKTINTHNFIDQTMHDDYHFGGDNHNDLEEGNS